MHIIARPVFNRMTLRHCAMVLCPLQPRVFVEIYLTLHSSVFRREWLLAFFATGNNYTTIKLGGLQRRAVSRYTYLRRKSAFGPELH